MSSSHTHSGIVSSSFATLSVYSKRPSRSLVWFVWVHSVFKSPEKPAEEFPSSLLHLQTHRSRLKQPTIKRFPSPSQSFCFQYFMDLSLFLYFRSLRCQTKLENICRLLILSPPEKQTLGLKPIKQNTDHTRPFLHERSYFQCRFKCQTNGSLLLKKRKVVFSISSLTQFDQNLLESTLTRFAQGIESPQLEFYYLLFSYFSHLFFPFLFKKSKFDLRTSCICTSLLLSSS